MTRVATLRLAALCAGIALLAPAVRADEAPVAKASPDAASSSTTYRVIYKTRIPLPAEGTRRLEAWIPTPMSDSVQVVRDLKVEANVPWKATEDSVTGNRYIHVLVMDPKEEVSVTWRAHVEKSVDSGQGREPVTKAHLASDALAPVDDRARRLAADVGATDTSLPVRARAQRIYDHVMQSMAYDKTPGTGWGLGDFARACEVGKGNCSDFAAKFITLTRAAGIPARWTTTISLAGHHLGCNACGYTCYAHFHDGEKWIPVNASDARKVVAKDPKKAAWYFGNVDSDFIVLSVGRDLTLVPRQQGAPLNFIAWAYAEADGKPIEIPATHRTYGRETEGDETAPASATPAR